MKELAIYIHIPFCISKCYYCDFNSYPNKSEYIPQYLKNLNREIKMYSKMRFKYKIKTIFIGGGTPSSINGVYIYEILKNIYDNFDVSDLTEVSIELNPKTVDDEKLKIYKEMGVNRISIGCQSLQDRLLKTIGRVHTINDFYKTYELLKKHGFSNINVDLMFGLPNQSTVDVLSTLKEVTLLDIKHISFYSLIIEEGTKFFYWYNSNKISLPEEDEERNMYHEGINYLKSKGYNHYEISNFAKEGFECEHNLFYWKLKPYIGLGLGSHSNVGGKRYWNYEDFESYFKHIKHGELPISGKEVISKDMEMAEFLILGLRLISGISKKEFYNRFEISVDDVYGEVLKKHRDSGLLYIDEENIRFTRKGLDLSNLVLVDLLP